MNISLGFSTLGEPGMDVDRIVLEARRCAATGVELRLADGEALSLGSSTAEAKEVGRRFAEAGITVLALSSYVRLCHVEYGGASPDDDATTAELVTALHLADAVGARGVRVFMGDVTGTGEALAARRLRAVSSLVAGTGVRVLIETHDSHSSALSVARFLERAGARPEQVGVIWDSAHTWVIGEAPAYAYELLAPFLAHVQIKDVSERGEPTELGSGSYPIDRLASVLRDYRGWASLEWERAWHPALRPLDEALSATRRWAATLFARTPIRRAAEPVLGPTDRFAAAFHRVRMPAEDRGLSPYTGLTREHWVAAADDLLLSAARYASPRGALLNLPGPVSQQGNRTDGLEGFARTFLLAAFLHAGGTADRFGHLERYRRGVLAGTGPGPDAWPAIGDIGRHGQPHVEAASIALSLHLTRDATWDTFTAEERDQVAGWLRPALDREPAPNNWYLFPLTIASFLEGVGRADEQTSHVIALGLALIEQWYRGEGWYGDGEAAAFDHYIGWALHFYPLLHGRLRGDRELLERLAPRMWEFLETFCRTFDRNGSPLHQGRSLTYRMATLAAVATAPVVGAGPLRPGQTRRILSATLRYFLERGATEDGVLTLGWHGPHAPTVQRYSGPGSPYWASKGFAALMLPADHPVWTSTEEPLPADSEDLVRPIGPIGWLVQATAADGVVRVHNHGSDHLKPFDADGGAPDPLYARFGYSTRTGPTALHDVSDNDVQVQVRGCWSVRRRVHAISAGPDWVASWHAPRFAVPTPFEASAATVDGPVLPSARIESVTVAHGSVEVRIHRLRGVPPRTPIRLSGWAVAVDRPEQVGRVVEATSVSVLGAEGLSSALVAVHGLDRADSAVAPQGTAFGRWAEVPELHGDTVDGALPVTTVVALARLTAVPDPTPLAECATVRVSGAVVTVDWRDTEQTRIDLDEIDWPRWM